MYKDLWSSPEALKRVVKTLVINFATLQFSVHRHQRHVVYLLGILCGACEGPHPAIPDFHPVMIASFLSVPLRCACVAAALPLKQIHHLC